LNECDNEIKKKEKEIKEVKNERADLYLKNEELSKKLLNNTTAPAIDESIQ
jgi:hypothetical protein